MIYLMGNIYSISCSSNCSTNNVNDRPEEKWIFLLDVLKLFHEIFQRETCINKCILDLLNNFNDRPDEECTFLFG